MVLEEEVELVLEEAVVEVADPMAAPAGAREGPAGPVGTVHRRSPSRKGLWSSLTNWRQSGFWTAIERSD